MENAYFLELLVRERLAEAQAFASKRAVADSLRLPRQPVRVSLGVTLIRVGHWLLGKFAECAGEPSRVWGSCVRPTQEG